MNNALPSRVRIVEVGPRDGLQNEKQQVSTDDKLTLIAGLVDSGLIDIEATAFVHPKWVPQLADAAEIVSGLPGAAGVRYSALVPNERGFERAQAAGIRRVAVITAASETFTQKNTNMSIAASIASIANVVRAATENDIGVRGYVSTAFVCPYEGEVDKQKVRDVVEKLLTIGVDEVAVSDTVGAAAPTDVIETVGEILEKVPADRIALHFHDTYGTALANVCAGLQLGVTSFDASIGGLGGCPYAPGAAGNVATEDLVYLLDRMGIETDVELDRLIRASRDFFHKLGRPPQSRLASRLS